MKNHEQAIILIALEGSPTGKLIDLINALEDPTPSMP
jgi:hypothetical protein